MACPITQSGHKKMTISTEFMRIRQKDNNVISQLEPYRLTWHEQKCFQDTVHKLKFQERLCEKKCFQLFFKASQRSCCSDTGWKTVPCTRSHHVTVHHFLSQQLKTFRTTLKCESPYHPKKQYDLEASKCQQLLLHTSVLSEFNCILLVGDYLMQSHNVGVIQLPQYFALAYCSDWKTLFLVLQTHLLQSHKIT